MPTYMPVFPQSKNLNWNVWFGEKEGETCFYRIMDNSVSFPGAVICLNVCKSIFNNQTLFSEHCKSGIACMLKNWKVQNMLLKLYIIDNKRYMQTFKIAKIESFRKPLTGGKNQHKGFSKVAFSLKFQILMLVRVKCWLNIDNKPEAACCNSEPNEMINR